MTTKRQLTSDEATEADIVKIEEKHGPITNEGIREELRQLFVNNMLFLYILRIGLRFEQRHIAEMLDIATDELKKKDEEILLKRKE